MLIRYFQVCDSYLAGLCIYATGVVLCLNLSILTHDPCIFGLLHVGMKARVAACSLRYVVTSNWRATDWFPVYLFSFYPVFILYLSFLLSQKALGQTSIGQMVNLLSNDVNHFDTSVLFLHYLWVGPLQPLIRMTILYHLIGPSCLAGFSFLILFIPLQGQIIPFSRCVLYFFLHWILDL